MFLLPKTKIYTVHINPSLPYASEKAVFVREGFDIFAFIFTTLWALYHKLWCEAFIIFTVMATLTVADKKDWLSLPVILILQIAFNLIIGFQANDLRRSALSRKGYITSDIVVSSDELSAKQRYFDRVLAV